MTTPAHWLVDKSALRPQVPEFADVLIPRIAAGRVAVCLVTELEAGYSARSTKDFERTRDDVIGPLVLVHGGVTPDYHAIARSRLMQTLLSRLIGVGVRPEHVRTPLMSTSRDDRVTEPC